MRPEGFENPYEPVGADLKKMGNQIAFEAGADHMVELLMDDGWFREELGRLKQKVEMVKEKLENIAQLPASQLEVKDCPSCAHKTLQTPCGSPYLPDHTSGSEYLCLNCGARSVFQCKNVVVRTVLIYEEK